MERASETRRQSTEDENLLLYWVFLKVTLEMALDIKRKDLAEKGKPLQLIRQELMATLDDSWGHNLKEKYRL